VNTTHRPVRALAATVAVAAIAALVPTTLSPIPAAAAPASPCGPLGKLYKYALNDRCDFGSNQDPEVLGTSAVVTGLQVAGLFAMTQECGGVPVPVVARPNELLVTADDRGLLDEAIGKLQSLLGPAFESAIKVNALAATIKLQPRTLDQAFVESTIPTLQGTTWSTDLNYLEPALPNNFFRPADNPAKAAAAATGIGGKGSVLVLDSPIDLRYASTIAGLGIDLAGPTATYDVDGNKFIDEDHGHGVFVAALVKRLAPGADVTLYGVNGGQIPGSGRWSPMMFSDADLVAAMGTAFGLSGAGTTTRRSFDVVNLSLGGASCNGVAGRLGLGRFMRDLAAAAASTGRPTTFVAAAGNDGLDVAHLPAAFRDDRTMDAAAKHVDDAQKQWPSPQGDAIRKIGTDLAASSIAVGSWTGSARDSFSNCGPWVNGIADGAGAVSRYPSSTSWASWSGTSFATPQVSAALVHGRAAGVEIKDAIGDC
jgi:hypothetical protein